MGIIVSDLFSIAIDGPVAVGKTVVGKKLAKTLRFIYLDTGLMYRAVTYALLSNDIDMQKESDIIEFVENLDIAVEFSWDDQKVFVLGEDVSKFLRIRLVEDYVSFVSSINLVRSKLVHLQREIANNNSIVMVGRDIGTIVLPNADLKIFLTATEIVRASRRFSERRQTQEKIDFDTVLEGIKNRDFRDSTRDVSPLKKSPDSILLDTTEKSVEDVVCLIIELIHKMRSVN